MLIRLRKQQGDTIVEVLIAIAIVSLTLTGAYVSVNRSSNTTRTAQERGEALKWAETQIEQIKASDANLADAAYASFCFDANLTLQKTTTPCVASGSIPYGAIIKQNPVGTGNFSVVVTWDALNTGVGTNTVELDYVK